jgi:hypothetical protein
MFSKNSMRFGRDTKEKDDGVVYLYGTKSLPKSSLAMTMR